MGLGGWFCDGKVTLGYPGGCSVITSILERCRRVPLRVGETGRWYAAGLKMEKAWVKECVWPLETGEVKEAHSLLDPPERT